MPFSRRGFLKASIAVLASIAMPLKLRRVEAAPYNFGQGRATKRSVQTFDRPSLSGEKREALERDTVFNIAGVTVGDENPAHNRVWYLLENGAFVHSGPIQPVRTTLNRPRLELPTGGLLAEVTVPLTLARWGPSTEFAVAYRMYYSSAHWLTRVLAQPDGQVWYRLYDDRRRLSYWGQAEHFRPISRKELAPIHAQVAPEEKWIRVDRTNQVLTAYEGERQVYQARTATGAVFSTGDFTTPHGIFMSSRKRPSRHMAGGDINAEDWFDLPGVPWVSYLTKGGVAIHGTYWHNDYGRPRSHGCINVTPEAAKWIYRWTRPHVPATKSQMWEDEGTRVEVI